MRRLTAALAAGALLLALIPSTAGAAKPLDVVFDTLVGDQVYLCGARVVDPPNGVLKQAASFTVSQPATITSVVLPLMVEPTTPASVEVKIVAAKPWAGAGGSGWWDNIPEESMVIARATSVTVSVLRQAGAPPSPCGPPADIVTAKFKKPARVSPGLTYWVVLQNPPGSASSIYWMNGLPVLTSSTFAMYGYFYGDNQWLAYEPNDFWRVSAMRLLGRVGK